MSRLNKYRIGNEVDVLKMMIGIPSQLKMLTLVCKSSSFDSNALNKVLINAGESQLTMVMLRMAVRLLNNLRSSIPTAQILIIYSFIRCLNKLPHTTIITVTDGIYHSRLWDRYVDIIKRWADKIWQNYFHSIPWRKANRWHYSC